MGAFSPSKGISASSVLNVVYVRKFSTDSTPGQATNLSQKSLSKALASCAEPALLLFGARPYQTISAHSAPADVPLKPTSSNRLLASMPVFLFFDIVEDFSEDTDLERSMHPATLAGDGY